MTVLVVGASGVTGRLLVEQLLRRGEYVRAIVRSPDRLPETLRKREGLSVVCASILELSDDELAAQVNGCKAIASCLGHNMSFKGIFGPPRQLVTEATRRLCNAAANSSEKPVKFVLMNTAGNSNRDLHEPISRSQQVVILLLRLLVPPHPDNEKAADYLRTRIGQGNSAIEWAAVRPDGLTQETEVTQYELHPSPTRSAIFDAGVTSRINVAHFMAELVCKEDTWQRWKGQMPVIYNSSETRSVSS